MEFGVLGRLQVLDGGRDLTPARPKRRAMLALLLLRAGELVSLDEAVEALWGERPPPAARNAVQGHVAALRKLLGPRRIETRGEGYLLELSEGELDLHRFERLLTDARDREPQERSEILGGALELFRGEPLADFRYEGFAAAEAARIGELRLLALEERLDADLALGRHAQVVPELERLVAGEPLRERLRGQLMLALYRSGRQADALQTYQHARDALVESLGIDPGPDLRRLERQILNQDPELELAPARPPGPRIPTPPTPLLGRERELAEAGDLVLRDDVRLLTLTGPGGTGKTRLALEVARGAASRFSGGTFFVPLASLADSSLVLPTIARAVGIAESGSSLLEESLAARLAVEETLLLLDNFEHLVAGAPALGPLLAAAPSLTLLVTSREPLRLYGEHVYRVPPLEADAAAELFLDRAWAANADIARDESTIVTVDEICERLDRLPLAIELAAARTTLFSPEALLERLGSRLALLTEGPVDHPERQQTLRRTLEWSHERLTAEEQRLFAGLSVFAGGWTLDAAQAVRIADGDVVEGLSSLVDKSLVSVESAAVEPRQSMLETIREYASERLADSGEAGVVGRRHAVSFLELAERAEPHLRGSPGEWLELLELEHDNLRAALDRLEGAGEHGLVLRLAGALWRFWYLRGYLSEGRQRLERALGTDHSRSLARAKALNGAAVMAVNTGDPGSARDRAQEALALNRELGDDWGAAYSGFMLGHVTAPPASAQRLFEDSIRVFRRLGDEHSALLATRHLAWSYANAGDERGARALHEDTLRRARATGNERLEASALGALAEYALTDARLEDAVSMLGKSLHIHRDLGDLLDTAVDLCRFAAALVAAGAAEQAARLLGAFDALGDQVGGRRSGVEGLNEATLARVRAQLDDVAFADAWEQGRALTLEQAVALALDPPGDGLR